MKFSWAIFLSLFSLQAYSIGVKSTGYIIPQGTSVRVSEHGECRQVHNGTSSYHFFIGTQAASEWTSFRNALPTGVTLSNCEATPRSCLDIKKRNPTATSGVYTIDPDGETGGYSAFQTYCNMDVDGGGWTRVAYMQDAAARPKVNPDFFVSEVNLGDIGLSGEAGTAASLNPEWFSKLVGTTDAMLVAPSYSATPYIDIALGIWDYDTPRCSGVLRHTGRNAGCAGQGANDNHNNEDRFNIAVINGTQGIVPNYGPEICYSGKGSCAFFFYLR